MLASVLILVCGTFVPGLEGKVTLANPVATPARLAALAIPVVVTGTLEPDAWVGSVATLSIA